MEEYLLVKIFCNIINVFTITLGQFNATFNAKKVKNYWFYSFEL